MRYARSARRYIAATAVTGMVTAVLVVAQAFLISGAVSSVISEGAAPSAVRALAVALGGVLAARALVVLLQEVHAHRSATETIVELRQQVLEHAARLGPRWQAIHGTQTATLLTRALDDLEPYFTRYLPQLVLASTVTPATVLVLLTQDWSAAVAVVCTLPLIPIFMILIGRMTQSVSQERLKTMQVLGDQVLDLISGLPTLKALGREHEPAEQVRSLGRSYRRTTMSTLRVAFLSGAVLEFITTLSVAIIAVQIGFRLVAAAAGGLPVPRLGQRGGGGERRLRGSSDPGARARRPADPRPALLDDRARCGVSRLPGRVGPRRAQCHDPSRQPGGADGSVGDGEDHDDPGPPRPAYPGPGASEGRALRR